MDIKKYRINVEDVPVNGGARIPGYTPLPRFKEQKEYIPQKGNELLETMIEILQRKNDTSK